MNGYDYHTIKCLEEEAANLGFKLTTSKYDAKNVSLIPREDCLPIYSRDAEMGYNGTIEGCAAFLCGWRYHNNYLKAIRATSDKVIERKEDLYRQKRFLAALRQEKNNEK